ncbi:MAG: hypothetical protein OHK0052_15700 [Anaerolineales bacterium]
MALSTQLSQEVNQLHAEICAALADPNRILMLYILSEAPRTVNDVAQLVGISQPSTSRHLKVLRERGLVRAERQGMSVEYRLADSRLIEALDLLRLVLHDNVERRATLLEI